MDRINVVWILTLLLRVFQGMAETTDPLTSLENIAGKLVFYQMDGNATYVRDTGELASDVPIETMFELFDPQRNFSKAKFTYTWDLGNGEVIQGTEPVVRYHYSQSGNYTLRLKVGVNLTEYASLHTDSYSMDVQVLDAIKHIELKEPSDYEVSQNSSLAFHVDGSPPLWVCWRFLNNCVPDVTGGCTLTMLYENTLRLNHTFTSAGVHCLDISVRNDISKLQTSFSLNVKRSAFWRRSLIRDVRRHKGIETGYLQDAPRSYNSHIFFILSCAAILVATFSFIAIIACRPHHHSKSRMAASSNTLFLKNHEIDDQSSIHFSGFSSIERGEKKPLLL